MEFSELFMEGVRDGDPAAVVVVHFLAMLELARESLLENTQAEPYAPIYVRLSYVPSA
jgi:segregation and condensation protein A